MKIFALPLSLLALCVAFASLTRADKPRTAFKVNVVAAPAAVVGKPVEFKVVLRNDGDATLKNVLVTALYSQGLQHESNAKALTLRLERPLAAGESRTLSLALTAVNVGKQSVLILASSGTISDSMQADVTVSPALEGN